MAHWAVQDKSVSIVLACTTFGISETCYRYRPVLNDENEEIADWLLRLTACHKRWGVGLCFLYLRNMKVLGWNQNGCIVFTVSWSRIYELSRMDFNADQLTNGQPFRTFNVLDDFDCEGLGIEVEVTLRSVRITCSNSDPI